MNNIRLFLLVVISTCFVTKNFSQSNRYRIDNGIGITGAVTKFDIATDNFETKSGDGFLGGLGITVDLPHRWYNLSYNMQLSENNIEILGRPDLISNEDVFIKYKMFAAQLSFLGHLKVISKYLTIDGGPMIQYNGRLELNDESQENYVINNYTNLSAKDISNISQVNVNGVIGVSAGYKFIRFKAQYIYGFTNILKKLEDENIDTAGGNSSFKGNQSMLVFGAVLSF
ncbi:hypothetical protein A8C32_18660 [Flavivirga aquatica]|uniref:Outer membrane protein beta-barrel domain-containing protein n=1 Tax=Flavivirga aquatica TaxID=1849968 RepID=A0A1E5T3Y1_9FLAO|nr:hypothetical protein [Flavivirga aquatica]OEK06056.1 hypothetical protein A8C32_18660 [Flavivirga aquatica]